MAKKGLELIDEFRSEVEEQRLDDKSRIWVSQGLSITGAIFKSILVWIPAIVLSSFLVALFLFVHSFNDVEEIAKLRFLSDGEMANIFGSIISLTAFFTLAGSVCFFAAYALLGRCRFRNRHQERLDNDRMEERLLVRIVEVQEELLIRHGLIEGEYNEKSN